MRETETIPLDSVLIPNLSAYVANLEATLPLTYLLLQHSQNANVCPQKLRTSLYLPFG